MTRKTWIIVLFAGGVGLAVLIGLLGGRGGESQADAQQAFCSSVSSLESSVQSLTSLSPTSASKDDYQSAVSDVDSAWDQVKTDAGDLQGHRHERARLLQNQESGGRRLSRASGCPGRRTEP